MGSPGPGLGFEQLTYGQEKFPRPSGQELHQHLDSALSLITDAQPMAAARELWLLQEFGLEHPALCWLLGDLLDESEPGNAMHHLQRIVDHPDFGLAASLQIGRLYNAHGRSREAAMAALQALRHADSETSKPDVDSDIYLAYDPALSSLSNEDDPHTLEQIYFGISAWLMQPGWRSWLPQERSRLLPLDQYGVQRPLADLFIEPVGGDMLAEITALRSLAARKSARFALEETLQTLGDFPESFSLQLLVADLLWLDWQRQDAINKSLLVARIFNLRDEKGQAIRILRRMSRRGAIDPALHQQLLELLHSSLRMEEALAESVQLARLYYQGADLTSSRAAYEDSLRITEKSPDRDRWKIHILNKIADIDLQRLDHRSALAVFEQICGLLPDDAYARSRLVELKYRLGQKDAANAGLESYLEMQKKHGRQEEALAFLKGLVEIMSDETSIHLQLARVYLEAGQREACVAQLDTVAGKMLESGNPRGAGTILKKIISLQPDNISAYEEALRNLQTRLGAG
jgi:predicted negative regulator of RcsB-dependent stress response